MFYIIETHSFGIFFTSEIFIFVWKYFRVFQSIQICLGTYQSVLKNEKFSINFVKHFGKFGMFETFQICFEQVFQVVAKGPVVQWLQETRQHLRSWVRLPMGANILGFNGVMHSVVGDVLVDSEAPVMTSSISRTCQLSLLEMLIGVGLCACIHRDECGCMFVFVCVCTIFLQKSTKK